MIENTLKIIIPSLFKAKIQYNILIMKFKLMQNLLANFAINSNRHCFMLYISDFQGIARTVFVSH